MTVLAQLAGGAEAARPLTAAERFGDWCDRVLLNEVSTAPAVAATIVAV